MDAPGLREEMLPENKYMGYKIGDLSESLKTALGNEDEPVQLSSSYLHYFESIEWIHWMPSLHTTLVMIYFLLLVCILGGISSFMWKKFDIKAKSQSKEKSLEHQLLGTGKYAQYVNAAVAFKIYQEEMAKMDSDSNDDDDDDSDDNTNDDNSINQSTLIGGYHKTKKLRARTVRKQKLREQKENYQRYKKRLEYEKQLKRYNKMKEKKATKKMTKKLKQQKKNEKQNKNKRIWFNSIKTSFMKLFENDDGINNQINEIQTTQHTTSAVTAVKDDDSNKSNKTNRRCLEEMIIKDCCNDVVIDLERYYLDKIKASDIYCKILRDLKALVKMVKSLCLKYKECSGFVDSNSCIYFRWNDECEQELLHWIETTGQCDVESSGHKMLAISREIFTPKT